MGTVTQEGSLYNFSTASLTQSDLVRSWTGTINVDASQNNSNNVVIEVYATDNANNTSSAATAIMIDITKPTITVAYNNNDANGDFFNKDRVATITVTERNFDQADIEATIKSSDGKVPAISGWTQSGGSGNGDNTQWIGTITYSGNSDYEFAIKFTDKAGNASEATTFVQGTVAPDKFTIDKIPPVITVDYNNNGNTNENEKFAQYFTDQRVATITIVEHNFDAANVKITITAEDNGAEVEQPVVSEWKSDGDTHTATIVYSEDAKYTFDVSYSDEARNPSEDYDEETFYIDTKDPEMLISGVEDKHAYGSGAEIIPVIGYSDTNFDEENVTITLNGVNVEVVSVDKNGKEVVITLKTVDDKTMEWKGTVEATENGEQIVFENFPTGDEFKDFDDIYTLEASLTDKSGRTSSQTVTFSVNRFGSTYDTTALEKLNGVFLKEPQELVIKEVNANKLEEISITIFKDNEAIELKEGDDFKVDIVGGDGEWYEYTYTIYSENFEEDGVYRVTLHSVDEAGNESENSLDTKGKEISFGIDKTPPTVSVAKIKSGETYAVENKDAVIIADDNLKLASITVKLDGENIASWNEEQIAEYLASGEEYEINIDGSSTKKHDLRVLCEDVAGNQTVVEVNDFYVTTNLLVRYVNNKPLFFGSIFGLLLLIGLIVFLVIRKKRS